MLQMKQNPEEVRMFNMDRFQALRWISKEQALEYQRDCELYWQEYCNTHNPQEKIETVDIINDKKPIIEEKTEEQLKVDMVKILKESGMKLASTKWSLATLTKKVAELKK